MGFECDLGWEYFGAGPMNSPRMMEHMDWHNAPENQNQTGNYGERFLVFHQQFIGKFDAFRISKALLPVTGWDPSTPIPAAFSHDHVLTAARHTDNPYSVNPFCKTPTWATIVGGSDVEPLYGYTSLCQFKSLDELGRAIDNGWHGTVHNTIGGACLSFIRPSIRSSGGGTNGSTTFARLGSPVGFGGLRLMKLSLSGSCSAA